MARPTILICDDEPSLRELMRISLAPDYSFVEAADGAEAIDARRAASRPDLVLLDVMMPGGAASPCSSTSARDPELSDTPVVVDLRLRLRARPRRGARRGRDARFSASRSTPTSCGARRGAAGAWLTTRRSRASPARWRPDPGRLAVGSPRSAARPAGRRERRARRCSSRGTFVAAPARTMST